MVYINTAHPDFMNGQKAMAIVNERMIMSKVQAMQPPAQAPQLPPAGGRPGQPGQPPMQPMQPQPMQPGSVGPLALPPSNAVSGDNSGFFNSFFAGRRPKIVQTPGGGAKLEQPPAMLKASGSLSEREFMETEVISTSEHGGKASPA